MNIEKVREIEKIDGWLSLGEITILMAAASNNQPETAIVEIGSWKGKSTCALATGAKEGTKCKVYAIDHFTGSEEHQGKEPINTLPTFLHNIKAMDVEKQVETIINSSEKAAPDFHLPIGTLFIDGSHDYDNVKLDFNLWSPKVVKDGAILFHDRMFDGPMRLITEIIVGNKDYEFIANMDSIAVFRKLK